MESRILISVAHGKELRVAVLRGNLLYDLDIEYVGNEQKKSNIYKGRISRIEPSLEAAFVDYGADRNGFLPLKEISREYFKEGFSGDFSNINIRDVIHEGMELIVQVDKEERGNKGAALTTFISLASSYLVLMPNNPRVGGISRRIDGEDRQEIRSILTNLQIPDDMGVIIRTSGIDRSAEELQRDLDILIQHWYAIKTASTSKDAPFLIYQESNIAIRSVRDHLRTETVEIIVDHYPTYERIKQYIELIKPEFIDKILFYDKGIPLFSSYQIERQIENAYQRVLHLPSGGSIVIDYTEALVSIDVNSSKAKGGSDIEETARNTNLEAVDEIARQLKLRDIGGLIVIDFIDMVNTRNQREVGQKLKDVLKDDRARVQIGKITRFGLLEMSRQRLRPHLSEAIQITCPRCEGQGKIRSIESLANSIIYLIEESANRDNVMRIEVQAPLDLATFILNEKRFYLQEIEQRHNVRILILPNQHLETPLYRIKTIRGDASSQANMMSYKLLEAQDMNIHEKQSIIEKHSMETAIVPAIFKNGTNVDSGAEFTGIKKTHESTNSNSWSAFKNMIDFIFKRQNKEHDNNSTNTRKSNVNVKPEGQNIYHKRKFDHTKLPAKALEYQVNSDMKNTKKAVRSHNISNSKKFHKSPTKRIISNGTENVNQDNK